MQTFAKIELEKSPFLECIIDSGSYILTRRRINWRANLNTPIHHPRDADSGSLAWDLKLCIDNKLPGDAKIWDQIWNKKLL